MRLLCGVSVMFQPILLGSLTGIFPWPPAALLPTGPRPPQRACQAREGHPAGGVQRLVLALDSPQALPLFLLLCHPG